MTNDEWVELFMQLWDAVVFLHSLNIIHNDNVGPYTIEHSCMPDKHRLMMLDFGKSFYKGQEPRAYVVPQNIAVIWRSRHTSVAPELFTNTNEKPSEYTDAYTIGYLCHCISAEK